MVEYTVSDKIAYITMKRPDKLNAMNLEMRQQLQETWRQFERDTDAWVGIVTGEGRAFSVGHDLVENMTPAMRAVDPGADGVYGGLAEISKPIIGAINGLAYAGGAAVAFMTDIRIAAEEAVFGWPQVRHGISSVSGPTILCRLLLSNQAFEYLFTGDDMTARDAERLGLVNQVVPTEELLPTATEFAERILRAAPLAVRNVKRTAIHTGNLPLRSAIAIGEKTGDLVHHTADAREGLRAFAARETPTWRGE